VVLFILAMSLFPKKFNRYLIPIFPVVDILAAIGIVGVIDFRHAQLKIKNLKSKIVLFSFALIAIVNAAWWHPFGIAYFNQALGGAQAGARTFLAGWGEGFEQVADWLNQQPDITGVVTVSPMVSSLQPYMRRHAQASGPDAGALPRKTGYVVVYIRQVQDGQTVPPFDQFYGRAVPLHTVRIHGVDYAYIYQVPPAVAHPRPADFGPLLHLRGFDPGGAAQRGKPLALKLSWEVSSPPSADYTLFAHLIGPGGRRYAQADLPYPTSQWRPGHPISTDLPLLIPADAPAGAYRLVIGLYDPASNQRLSLTSADPIDPALDGPDALPLTEVRLD
jgi:hypothetical protein